MNYAVAAMTAFVATAALAAPDGTGVSFKQSIVPVLKSKCATCHLTGQEGGRLALYPGAAYASLVAAKSNEADLLLVKPGAPDESYLLMKLQGTHLEHGGQGARMPFGAPPLEAETIAKVRDWIAAGAPDN
jgi:hypothetical protein